MRRAALGGAALLLLSVTAGFYFQWSWATDLWPWPDSRLSYIFVASILAAIALPTLWIAISGELGAIQAGALNLAVVYGGACIYLITLLGDPGQPDLAPYVAVFGGALLTTIAAFVLARRIGFREHGAVPAALRVSFGLLAGILAAVGTALVLQADVFPWDVPEESSVIFGLIFLGAAVYFVHGVARPIRANAIGQLVGFLAYDAVLVVPFAERFDEVGGLQLLSLTIYSAVIVFSAALGVYYLVIHPETRLVRSGAGPWQFNHVIDHIRAQG